MGKLTKRQTKKIHKAFFNNRLSYASFVRKYGFEYGSFYKWINGKQTAEKCNMYLAYTEALKKEFGWEEL